MTHPGENTPTGQSVIELTGGELREVRWRAFLAGFDAQHTQRPLEEYFQLWLEHEVGEHLGQTLERVR